MSNIIQKKIRFALIGCGTIANKHVIAIRRVANAEVVGAHDIEPVAAEEFKKKYHIPTYANVEEMISDTNPDVLNILTPSGDHAERILELMRFNKHFVVEKPLALRLEEVDEVIRECSSRGIELFVVQQNRFNPPIRKLKEALDKGRFGKLVLGTVRVRWNRDQAYYDQKLWRGTWAYDGGVLVNQALHHLDMLLWLMGDVESVVAKTELRLVNIEAEDTAVAIIKFRNGALGIIEATTATRPKDLEGSISILGEKGSVEVGGFFMNELKTWNFSQPNEMDKDIWEKHAKVPEEIAWNHTEFLKDVVSSLLEHKKGLIDGKEGRKSVELVTAIYESAETDKEIFLCFRPKKCRLGVTND
jgi:UDP-N-acetyl-2-amino-2-deoxyglucuronate dehydrogenase